MSKNKSRKHKQVHIPSAGSAQPTCAYAQMDGVIAMLGHTDVNGNLHSKIDFSTSDKKGLQGLELVFRQAMTKAIKQHDVDQFRKSYVAMERILGIDMENYEGLELHFPEAGKIVNHSPSELCLAFKAWPIYAEVFQLSLAHPGVFHRTDLDSPLHLLFRLGSWLKEPELQSELADITQLTKDVVDHFLIELKPTLLAYGLELKTVIHAVPFLKELPLLEKIVWTQYAAMPV